MCVRISSAHSHCHRCWVPWPLRRHFSSEVWVGLDRPQGSHQPCCSLTCSKICFWMLVLFSYLFPEAPMADPGQAEAPAAPFALVAPSLSACCLPSAADLDGTSPLPGLPAAGLCWPLESVSLG